WAAIGAGVEIPGKPDLDDEGSSRIAAGGGRDGEPLLDPACPVDVPLCHLIPAELGAIAVHARHGLSDGGDRAFAAEPPHAQGFLPSVRRMAPQGKLDPSG